MIPLALPIELVIAASYILTRIYIMTEDTQGVSETISNQPSATIKRIIITRRKLDTIEQSAADIIVDYVHVPEWSEQGEDPDQVYACIRSLSGADRDEWENSIVSMKGNKRSMDLRNARAKLVSKCLIDPETKRRLYTDAEIQKLGKRNAAVLDRLYDACRKLSGISEEDQKEIEEDLKSEE